VEGKMNRHERRKANKEERKFLPKGCEVTEVDLTDPDLEPGLRDAYIKAIKGKVAQLDELIGRWYRRPECSVPGCDCGEADLVEQVGNVCCHLAFIKRAFGETIVENHPSFGRLVRDAFKPGAYQSLTAEHHHL
jgi:hypothetical protein